MEAIDHRWGQSPEKIFGVVGCDIISQLVFMVVLLYIDHKKTFIGFFYHLSNLMWMSDSTYCETITQL